MDGRLIYLMGPSGSGKDSLIEASRVPLLAVNCEVVRRIITRSAESVGEDAIGVSREEFQRRRAQGDFALCWNANGLDYGIPVQIDDWLAKGRDVLVNGSRGHVAQALARYPSLLPIVLVVPEITLRDRLLLRDRESSAEIEARLIRNKLFDAGEEKSTKPFHRLDNSGDLTETVTKLLHLMRVSAEPDRI